MKFTEETLEFAILELFATEQIAHHSGLHIHKEIREVLLKEDLKLFLLNQYQDITLNEITTIIRQLENYPNSPLYDSNKIILKLIADGFALKREDRSQKDLFIQLIDYQTPENNTFKIINQLEIQGYEKRIPDAIIYINGLPLIVFEFKSAVRENATIKDAHTQLTVRYQRDIPELFKYNAFCVISDGVNNKSGSIFADYDFFYAWRKTDINSKPADGINSLHTMIKGLFNKTRLLDVIKNFIYFPDTSTKNQKIVCRYPQYYAANILFENIKTQKRPEGNGKGGTYFGATGCGKSYTMLYLARLLMKSTELASPTIILMTDRTDLHDQLAGQFTNAKNFIGDQEILEVESREDLKNKLQGRKSGGVFLTTIQKFTETLECLSERNNIICISDEAHRSQINLEQKLKISKEGVKRKYGFAKYLHDSLPNATYVGFTGTPLDATLDVFGAVIDAYTMKESVEDQITVRIVYEGRAAKVLLKNEKLKEIETYYQQCAEGGTNDYQIEESKKATTKLEAILGDPKRLKAIAQDFIAHYETRVSEGATIKGKALFVASNRTIAYDLYKEIIALRPQWAEPQEISLTRGLKGVSHLCNLDRLEAHPTEKISGTGILPVSSSIEKIKLVMTRDKDDPKELYEIIGAKEYRKELDRQFKDSNSNFKMAIVVDMWMTGFDVPFLDTIYIDKPIQQHSLIQTISRVNRVYEGKETGLVVDYIGIKSNLNLALKKYSTIEENDFEDSDKAVVIVKDQLDLLAKLFIKFDTQDYFNGTPLQQLNCLNRAAEFVQLTDELEKRFMGMVKKLRSAYSLCCSSEDLSETERDQIHFYFAIRAIVFKLNKGDAPDIAQMNERVREMIQEALLSEGVEEILKLGQDNQEGAIDIFSDEYLAKIDQIKLPNTKIKLLQNLLNKAIATYKKVNKIKGVDFSKKLKALVDRYNERPDNITFANDVLEDVAQQFADLFKELQKERNSFMDLGINFEEKAFYDILKSVAHKYNFEYPEAKLIKLSREVKKIVDDKAKYTDWSCREDIKAELKVDLILVLADNDYPLVPKDEVFKEIFEQAENFKKYN